MSNIIKIKVNNHIATGTGKPLSLFKHLKAILDAKSTLNTVNNTKRPKSSKLRSEFNRDELNNVAKTYMGVVSKKKYIDNRKPNCIKAKKSKFGQVPTYDQIEHKRRLKSIGNRIQYFGTIQDRLKKRFDPIANPVYFYKHPKDYEFMNKVNLEKMGTKLDNFKKSGIITNNVYSQQWKDISKDEIYDTDHYRKHNNSLIDLMYLNEANNSANNFFRNSSYNIKTKNESENENDVDLNSIKYKHDVSPDLLINTYSDFFKELKEDKNKITNNMTKTKSSMVNKNKIDSKQNNKNKNKNEFFKIEEAEGLESGIPDINESEKKSKIQNKNNTLKPSAKKSNNTNKFKSKKIEEAPIEIIKTINGDERLYNKIKNLIPLINGNYYSQEDLLSLKDKIVKILYENRIYKDDDITLTFELVRSKNSHIIEYEDLENILGSILIELNS